MADAVNQVAKETRKPPIVLSLCEWGWVCQTCYCACGGEEYQLLIKRRCTEPSLAVSFF